MAGSVTWTSPCWCRPNRLAPDAIATLIGSDRPETITLDDVAGAAGTISYEILTGLGPRVQRVYR